MSTKPHIPAKPFTEHGKEIEAVLRRAVRAALLAHKRMRNSVAVWRDGEVVILSPEEIPLDEETMNQEAA